jgi:hypothetical protein
MGRQGQLVDENTVRRIAKLLASTDMTIMEIAQRMCCSSSLVASINRRQQIRRYDGHRASWQLCQDVYSDAERVNSLGE